MKALAKWSVSEYHRLVECGLLRARRFELLRGDIVEISPESPIHYATAKRSSKYTEEQILETGAVAPLAFPAIEVSVERLPLQALT